MTRMNNFIHRFTELFAQLGLPSTELEIRQFMAVHSPLADHVMLADAPFWTVAQATFLRDELFRDADWAAVVDQLNAALRAPPAGRGGSWMDCHGLRPRNDGAMTEQ